MFPKSKYTLSLSWLKLSLLLLLSLGIWQVGIRPARADIWTICQTGGCDFNDIQTAVNNASVQDGDILSFTVNRETFSAFTLSNKALTFQGFNTEINASESGSAITITGNKTVSFNDFSILNGNGTNGGGIQLNSGNLTLTDVMLTNNDASNQGGALYIGSSNSTVTLTDVTIASNTAATGGGIYNNGTLTADNLTLSNNYGSNGGGLYNNGTAILENQSTVQRNGTNDTQTMLSGGGIYNTTPAMLTIIDSDVANNEANNGAGIYNEGTLQLTNANLGSNNEAAQTGGGLYNSAGSQATLANSSAVQNVAVTGAGIYNEGTLIVNNSTLSRNDGANGAGLYNMSGSSTLNNVTTHLTIGTSLFVNGGTVTVGNSILSSASGFAACGGTAVSNGYNLANDQSCTFLTSSGDQPGVDPQLNGITSPDEGAAYHSPQLTSPAVDTGNPATPGSGGAACLARDQLGLARPQSRQCDIGAVEIVVYRLYIPSVLR